MQLNVSHSFLPKSNSTRAAMVMQHFGIDFEQGEHVIADGLEIPVQSGQLVLFTGESGSGKSSLMRAVAKGLRDSGESEPSVRWPSEAVESRLSTASAGHRTDKRSVIDVDDQDLGDSLLIDRMGLPFDESLKLLSSCGLGEAHLMLRTPAELSEGQRYRFRLALALSQQPDWVLADEFTATLDRNLAKVVSFNLRKVASRSETGFLLATTHEDVVDDLSPDLHVRCHLNGQIDTILREDNCKKKDSHLPTTCGSVGAPSPIGRTSLGGITAAIKSPSSGT